MGATGVAAWLAQHVEGLGGITAIAGYVATGAAALTSMIAPANKRVRAFLDSLTRVKQDYDVQLAATLEENPENAEIKKHRDQHDAAALKLQAAREHVAELELRRAKLDPFKQLSSFLNERVQADDYRRRQGIIALVRRDFERLSTLMKAWRTGEAERPQNVEPIDRIILYVDDLDRCTPQQVVQMLEATHLLLAMDLFVVVAAVDSRWLLRSLEVHYERLLDDSGREPTDDYRLSSPQNYLEKIFQIPFAVRAMEEDGFGEYAEHLLGTIHGPEKAAPTGPKPTDAQGEAVDTPTTDPEADPSDPTAPRPEEPLVPEAAVARPLTISDEELAFFKLLHPPRAHPAGREAHRQRLPPGQDLGRGQLRRRRVRPRPRGRAAPARGALRAAGRRRRSVPRAARPQQGQGHGRDPRARLQAPEPRQEGADRPLDRAPRADRGHRPPADRRPGERRPPAPRPPPLLPRHRPLLAHLGEEPARTDPGSGSGPRLTSGFRPPSALPGRPARSLPSLPHPTSIPGCPAAP